MSASALGATEAIRPAIRGVTATQGSHPFPPLPPAPQTYTNSNSWGGDFAARPSSTRQQNYATPVPESHAPIVRWIEVSDTSSLVAEGYFTMAPVVQWNDSIQTMLSGSNNILYDLDNDVFEHMTYNHDADWSDFPEVGAVLRQNGYEELAICVAICPPRALWAVGMASKQRHRLQAARLAMCLALAANADSLTEIFQRHPEFLDLCRSADIAVEDAMPNGASPPPAPANTTWTSSSKSKRKKKREYTQEEWDEWNAQNEEWNAQKQAKSNGHWKEEEWQDWHKSDKTSDADAPDKEGDPTMAPETEQAPTDPPMEDGEAAPEAEMAAPVEVEQDASLAESEALAAKAEDEAKADAELQALQALTAKAEAELAAQAKLDDAEAEVPPEAPPEVEPQAEEKEAEVSEPPPKMRKVLIRKATVPQQPIPRDEPLWLWLDSLNEPLQAYALGSETLALASDGSKRKGLYTQADKALRALLGEEETKIVLLDDSDWTKFPCVGEALKTRGEKEECFTIAISPAMSLWGIGVGMKGWVRHRAAKIALATVVAMQKAEVGEEIPDFSSAPAVADFLEEARKAKDTMLYA